MEISARVLREVEFSGSLRGYNTDEVDEFLEKVALAVDGLQAELRAALERAERQPIEVQTAPSGGDDDTLRRTLVLAQRTADLAIKEAQEEADQLIQRARAEAETTLGEAKRSAETTLGEAKRSAETTLGEAKRSAERLTSEAERRLREEVARLTGARDDLRREVDTLMSLLAAERERLSESLGTALRYVERSLTLSPDFKSRPAGSGRESPSGNRAAPPSSEPVLPAEELAVSAGEVPLSAGESASTGGESASTGGESASTGGESASTGGESASTGGESASTGGESAVSGRGADTAPGSGEPVPGGDEAAAPTAFEPPSWADERPERPSEPVSWRSERPSEQDSATAPRVGEFEEWDFDDDSERSPTEEPRTLTSAPPLFRSASLPRQRVVEVPAPAVLLRPPPEAESWGSPMREPGLEGDELDDLEAAIAEDAAAAAPSGGRYDDEFSWDARRSGRRDVRKGPERPNLTAVPALDDTMQDPRVWKMGSGPSDDPA